MTIPHTDNSMELGVITFFRSNHTLYWIRDIDVHFFGCYETCTDCLIENSPLNCTSCIDGYYLINNECK